MSGRVQYSKPQTNSFRSNLFVRNPSSTVSSTQDVSMYAGQLASSEAQAAVAANNLDMELEDLSPARYNPDSPLVDYNEEDPIPALRKSTSG